MGSCIQSNLQPDSQSTFRQRTCSSLISLAEPSVSTNEMVALFAAISVDK